MNVNPTGYAALIVAVFVFLAVYAFSSGLTLRWRLVLTALFCFLSVPSVLVVLYYLHILPETGVFYSYRSVSGSEFAILFAAVAGGLLSTFLPRVLIGVPLLAVLLGGALPYIKPLVSPLDFDLLQDRWEGDACLQSTPSTCGPASVATALRSLGVRLTEKDVAKQAFSYTGGTEAWYLARVVRKNGGAARFVISKEFDQTLATPVVVGVRLGGMGHFIVVVSRQGDTITFVDPLSGQETIKTEDFIQRYKFTGFHMTVAKR